MKNIMPISKKITHSIVISLLSEGMTPFVTISGKMTVNRGLKNSQSKEVSRVMDAMVSLLTEAGLNILTSHITTRWTHMSICKRTV